MLQQGRIESQTTSLLLHLAKMRATWPTYYKIKHINVVIYNHTKKQTLKTHKRCNIQSYKKNRHIKYLQHCECSRFIISCNMNYAQGRSSPVTFFGTCSTNEAKFQDPWWFWSRHRSVLTEKQQCSNHHRIYWLFMLATLTLITIVTITGNLG
jgi:hypothetical protein